MNINGLSKQGIYIPDFDDMNYDEINWDEVLSGNMILMSFLSSIYYGDDTFLRLFHKEFVEKWKKLKR